MIRVLQCVNNMHRAGLETMLMNYYRSTDRARIQFDFLTHRPFRSDYDDEIEALGGRVYYAPRLYPQNYPAYFSYMKKFFAEHPEYRIVHSHIDTMSYLPLLAAKKAGVPVRIAHSHNTSIDRDLKYPLKLFFKGRLHTVLTHRLSCGEDAGRFLFGDADFTVIPNAVDASAFAFDESVRAGKRQELSIGDELVIGHIGRMSYQKNHRFLLDVFKSLLQLKNDALLMLIGSGEYEEELRTAASEMGITDRVRFLGSRSDVAELYQAMDVFVLPSLFEGIPVVGVEAQFAGLPCFFSGAVPREVAFTEGCRFIGLEEGAGSWAKSIAEIHIGNRDSVVTDPRYDIKNAHGYLEELYLSLSGEDVDIKV